MISIYNISGSSPNLQKIIDGISDIDEMLKTHSKKDHIHIPVEAFLQDGKYYDGMIHILRSPLGKLKGYTIELRDNTEHYKSLALKERYNDELAKEVEEKTSKIKTIHPPLQNIVQIVSPTHLQSSNFFRIHTFKLTLKI